MSESLVIRRGGELDGLLEELRHAILDLVLRHELSTPPSCQFRALRPGAHIPTHKRIDAMGTDLGGAEVEPLDLLGALRQIGPVEHCRLLRNARAHLQPQEHIRFERPRERGSQQCMDADVRRSKTARRLAACYSPRCSAPDARHQHAKERSAIHPLV